MWTISPKLLKANRERERRRMENPEYAERKRANQRTNGHARRRKDLDYKKRTMVTNARSRSKKRGWETTLRLEDIVWPTHCPVFPWIELDYSTNPKKKPNIPSLDRLDNSKGYVAGNVWVISWRANELKRDATLDEMKCLGKYADRVSS